jgi:hypothetical protein
LVVRSYATQITILRVAVITILAVRQQAVTALLLQPPQQHEAACTAPITRTALKNRTASATDNDA